MERPSFSRIAWTSRRTVSSISTVTRTSFDASRNVRALLRRWTDDGKRWDGAIERPTPGRESAVRTGPVTVAELEQIPGAREALVRYIRLLQEWAEHSAREGSSPKGPGENA